MPTPRPCPGTCNTAWRRAETALADNGTEHHLTPNWGTPVQCPDCVERTRAQLRQLPALLAAVRDEPLEGTPAKLTGTIGRVGLVHAWPGQAARMLIDRVVGEMAELQADILVRRGIWQADTAAGPGTRSDEDRYIASITTTLTAHWDWAMQHHPAADEEYDRGSANPGSQAASWHRTATFFIKDHTQREVRRLAPCPRCRGPWLVESTEMRLVNGRPYVLCTDPTCGRVLTMDEYERYVKDMTRAISAEDIVAA